MSEDYRQVEENVELLNKEFKSTKKSKLAEAKELFKQLRPDKNQFTTESGTTIKWKVKPSLNKEKVKAKLEINTHIDDVEIYAKVDGKLFKIAENGIGQQDEDILTAEVSATKRF